MPTMDANTTGVPETIQQLNNPTAQQPNDPPAIKVCKAPFEVAGQAASKPVGSTKNSRTSDLSLTRLSLTNAVTSNPLVKKVVLS